VVLLGSLGSTRAMWDPQLAGLSSRLRVLAVDLRGHGDSPAPAGPYTIADLGADVVTLLDALGLERVHVAGLSIGGAVGQWLAVHHPDRVHTLALLCTSARFGPPEPWLERAATARRDGTAALAEAVAARWLTPELAARNPDLVARSRAMIAGTDDEGYAACCEAIAAWDGSADLERIAAPTLAIAGAQDPATPPEHLELITSRVQGSALHVLDPGAHLVNLEQPDHVAGLLLRHITGSGEPDEHARLESAPMPAG
jgi:3-oxoadipate enol-lactonase/4-carboxymuconolactone decarboxylase